VSGILGGIRKHATLLGLVLSGEVRFHDWRQYGETGISHLMDILASAVVCAPMAGS
jgi:hypothetical protein